MFLWCAEWGWAGRYKKLQIAEEKMAAENQRLQREIYALITYPHDVTEERRNQERERFDSLVRCSSTPRRSAPGSPAGC